MKHIIFLSHVSENWCTCPKIGAPNSKIVNAPCAININYFYAFLLISSLKHVKLRFQSKYDDSLSFP